MNTDLIEIARIKGPNGLKGRMWITPYGDSFEAFSRYTHLIVGKQRLRRRLVWCVQRKNGYIIELEGITSIDQAEKVKGETLYISREQLTKTDDDEYYWCDLLGMSVVDIQGRVIGDLIKIFPTGSNDVYVVDPIKQYYIPATADVVKEISLARRQIVIDTSLIEDLLD